MRNRNVIFVALFVFLNYILSIQAIRYDPDLQGSYCAARKVNQCCSDRQDECSVPIRGTLCYCDDFCNRTRNGDCCPDYWSYCKGAQEISDARKCYEHGQYYGVGETTKINCNLCECQELNGKIELLCESKKCLVDEEILDRINKNNETFGWTATNYTQFWGESYEKGLSYRLGTLKEEKVLSPIDQKLNAKIIPTNFDARIKWPGTVSRPKDQGWCNASWIFSTVSVASDRFAKMTYGNDQNFLSSQQILSCSRSPSRCDGGYLTQAWTYIRKYGLVPETCYPWEGAVSNCNVPRRRKLQSVKCPAFPRGPTHGQIHRVGPAYRVAGELGIMQEILSNGPVQATMTVSRDFFSYHSGIYRCMNMNDDVSAFHSVRVIGWGQERQNDQMIKYWVRLAEIVANSWGEWWGEDGYFRIRRGVNECMIEDYVIAAWANVEDLKILSDAIIQSKYRLVSNNI